MPDRRCFAALATPLLALLAALLLGWSVAAAQEAGGDATELPLTVTLTSSRAICTANTLTEMTWTITGGVPPYRLTVAGEAVDPGAESATVTCGALPEGATEAPATVTAVVMDSAGTTATASAAYTIVPPLPAPTGLGHALYPGSVNTWWDDVPGVAELPREDSEGTPYTIDAYLVRYRAVGASEWIHVLRERTVDNVWEVFNSGIREFSVAALRHPLEQLTPDPLRWSAAHPYAPVSAPQNVVATATHDTVTVRWDKQPHSEAGVVILYSSTGMDLRSFPMATSAGRHSVTFGDLPPSATYRVLVEYPPPEGGDNYTSTEVTTLAAPPDYEPPPSGPQNLRATATQNSITVSWEASRPTTPLSYGIQVFLAESGIRVAMRHPPKGVTSVTVIGNYWRIQPDTLYKVVVYEHDIRAASAELSIRTPASPGQAADAPPGARAGPPLRLSLAAERSECTAGTLNPVSWEITGGVEPYRLTVDGASVDADADGATITCGALPDYGIWLPVTQPPGTITAVVTGADGVTATASAAYTIVPPLPAPAGLGYDAQRTLVQVLWERVAAAGPTPTPTSDCPCPLYLLRWRVGGTESWTTVLHPDGYTSTARAIYYMDDLSEGTTYQVSIAALRDAIEQETPAALNWSTPVTVTTMAPPTGVRATATHDTITVTWDPQPAARFFTVGLNGPRGAATQQFTPGSAAPYQVVFRHLPPDTEYTVQVGVPSLDRRAVAEITVSTTAAPADWTPLARGPQNLRTAVTHDTVAANWDAPYAGAHDVYHVWLHPPGPGRSQRVLVLGGNTSHTFTGLAPTTTYRVSVTHSDIIVKRVETSVTTAAAPLAAQSTGPVTTCFEITAGWRICFTPAVTLG